MTNRECRDTRREIDELEFGHRPGAQAMAHMVACRACQEFHAERTSLRELVGGLEPIIAPPDFNMRLRARIAAEKYDKRRQPFFASLMSTPALAAAALFVIVAGSVYWISRRPVTPTMPANQAVANNKPEEKVPAPVRQQVAEEPVQSNEGADVAVNTTNRGSRHSRGNRSAGSEQFNVLGTEVIRQTDSDQAYVPNRPVEFALQDERGKTRKISLPPVSFGAQNVVGSNRTDVKYTETSRVW